MGAERFEAADSSPVGLFDLYFDSCKASNPDALQRPLRPHVSFAGVPMTMALLIALAGSLAAMALIVRRMEQK